MGMEAHFLIALTVQRSSPQKEDVWSTLKDFMQLFTYQSRAVGASVEL